MKVWVKYAVAWQLLVCFDLYGQPGFFSDSPESLRSAEAFYLAENHRDQQSREFFCERELSYQYGDSVRLEEINLFPSLTEIQSMMEEGEVMLELQIIRDSLFSFWITRRSLKVLSSPFDQETRNRLRMLIKNLKSGDLIKMNGLRKKFSSMLIRPAHEILSGNRRLIVIPVAEFSGLPFEVLDLQDGEGMIIDSMEVVYQTSAWRWFAIRSQPHSDYLPSSDEFCWGYAGLAPAIRTEGEVAELPWSEIEVNEMGTLLSSAGLAGQIAFSVKACEARFEMIMYQAEIVHLATHSLLDPSGDQLFSLLLSPSEPVFQNDGIHDRNDFRKFRVYADLLVLNTCSSAIGPCIPYEGSNSLIRGFLQAGAPNVIGTLWNLSAYHAHLLIIGFYRHCREGKTFSEALRAAKLDFLANQPTSNPFFWAPYVIYGD
jgi:CHAT domain-containing protein